MIELLDKKHNSTPRNISLPKVRFVYETILLLASGFGISSFMILMGLLVSNTQR